MAAATIARFHSHTPPSETPAVSRRKLPRFSPPDSRLARAKPGAHKTENLVPPLLLTPQAPAILALADGTVFQGISIGTAGVTVGEVVFNTALTGYQEILTDPSYCRQIVTLTYPHIGNYGINDEDIEATKVHAAGLIIKDLPVLASNFRMAMTLPQYLQREGTMAIAGIDTRRLTRLLRSGGAQSGCILTLPLGAEVSQAHRSDAIARAAAAPSMAGLDLAKVVSEHEP